MFYKEILYPIVENIEKFGGRNAFCINRQFYTYRQFGETVCKVRTALVNSDFKNTNVGLVANDDLETYATIIALWLEGCGYVPLHPGWPLDRCEDIISQVGIDLILDSSKSTR